MENVILNTVVTLSLVLVTITGVGIAAIQYVKEKWGVKDKAAEIVSLASGFLMGGAVVVSYLEQLAWHISISQGIGIGMFMVIATIGPSGGYKTLRSFLGKDE